MTRPGWRIYWPMVSSGRASYPRCRSRPCATSPVPASSSPARRPATSSASTRPFRPPTSSSARRSRTSWGRADGPCLRRSRPAKAIPSSLPAWSGPRSGPPTPRSSHAQVVEAVRGRLCAHQRLLLRLYLAQVDALAAAIAAIDHDLGERLAPVQETVRRLTSMPVLSPLSAAVVISEIGLEMSRFPRAAHLISWAGLCPKNDESAGKRRSTRLRPGAPWLKAVLVQSAWCAVRVKASHLHALFQRLKARRGPRKAIVAVAAAMLTAIYHMLKRGAVCHDLGPDHFQRTERSRLAARLARKLGELGFDVTLTQRAAT